MLGVVEEMPGAVLIDRVDLIDFVFAETVDGERVDSDSEGEDRGDRQEDEFRVYPRQRLDMIDLPGRCNA